MSNPQGPGWPGPQQPGQSGTPQQAAWSPQPPQQAPGAVPAGAGEIPRTTPPEIAKKIRRARIIKLLGIVPLLCALLSFAGFASFLFLDGISDDWFAERKEAEARYKRYYDCRGDKREYLNCEEALRPGAKPPKPAPKKEDAPFYAAYEEVYVPTARLLFGAGVVLSIIGGIWFLIGRSRHNQARRQDPSRVIIAHSRALEILAWIGCGIGGAVGIGLGASQHGSDGVAIVLLGLVVLSFAPTFQLVLYAVRPSEADTEGFRLGFGRRLLWRNFQNKTLVTVNREGRRVDSYYKLHFTNGTISVNRSAISEWDRMARFVNEGVGAAIL